MIKTYRVYNRITGRIENIAGELVTRYEGGSDVIVTPATVTDTPDVIPVSRLCETHGYDCEAEWHYKQ